MRILHYYPSDDKLIASYVTTLCDTMGVSCVNEKATEPSEALSMLHSSPYDILHLHGCWRTSAYRIVKEAFRHRVRTVVSPHGQLEPWVMHKNFWKEKLPKRIIFQRYLIQTAYAVVLQGGMEEECLQKLSWNKRTQIIRNCLITQSITPQEMSSQMAALYRKVMDSYTWELMDSGTKDMLRLLIHIGITGDRRWGQYDGNTPVSDWRQLFCYAHQEQIIETVRRGLRILEIDAPFMDMEAPACFLPDHYETPVSIGSAIGMQYVSENDRLLATFRYLRKLAVSHRLTIMHLVELNRELRSHDCDEEQLAESLQELHLDHTAARILQLTAGLTGLTEGFLPLAPINDRTTRRMLRKIEQHLKINTP